MCISFLIVNENQNYGWIKNITFHCICKHAKCYWWYNSIWIDRKLISKNTLPIHGKIWCEQSYFIWCTEKNSLKLIDTKVIFLWIMKLLTHWSRDPGVRFLSRITICYFSNHATILYKTLWWNLLIFSI